jgi:hypothetical protein
MSSTAKRAVVSSVLVLMMAPLTGHAAGPMVDKETGVRFHPEQTINGTTFQCLGAGVRKVIFVNVYAAEFCLEPGSLQPALDDVAAAKAKGGSATDVSKVLASDPALFDSLMGTAGDKLLIMHMVRDVSREQLAKAFRESLSKVLPPEKVEKLLAIIPGNASKNEDVKISSAGDTLTIDIAGKADTIHDAEIAQKIWSVWLGPHSVSPSLKQSIATNLVQGL